MLMTLQALSTPRFVRKTQLGPNEYRKNFQQIDNDILSTITSAEASSITPLMSKIYLSLLTAPTKYWEREGVLHLTAEIRGGKQVNAWNVLCHLVGVASATANKAFTWMHEQGIIGYFSGKNGVGIRIFLNRATASIGIRSASASKKILVFRPASSVESPASQNEAALNDSYAVKDTSDTDINPHAPKIGADISPVDKIPSEPPPTISTIQCPNASHEATPTHTTRFVLLEDAVVQLKAELEPTINAAARKAAAREHERTREWLENRGLPKAARVAQHEAYNVLRKYGLISESARSSRTHAEVGRSEYTPSEPHALSSDEVTEMAGACVAMLETKGQAIELTLSEMSVEAGGILLPDDEVKVREKANYLLSAGGRQGK
jgi:hypothetical protein